MQGRKLLGYASFVTTSIALLACGGGAKQAEAPATCPAGTVLRGSDCVPDSADKEPSETAPSGSAAPPAPSSDATGASPNGDGAGGKTPYDKDAVEAELKRAARSIKASCGAATDEDGQATGPWGTTKATVTLGRNGHVKQVAVPPPYDGKPVGVCVVHAFEKIWFPPYAAPADVAVDWEVELVKPKK